MGRYYLLFNTIDNFPSPENLFHDQARIPTLSKDLSLWARLSIRQELTFDIAIVRRW